MARLVSEKKANFGTLPVFMTAVSTILGAILFLRFGYAVAHVGFLGVIGLIVIGHLVTFPTAMAVAEIATNQRVRGGGAYFILSRSFGLNIGAAIGIALYLSQAISIAFYIIAFAEAFDPLITWLDNRFSFVIPDNRYISIPTMVLLSVLFLTRGANLGMKFLYLVVMLLFSALVLFFAGNNGNNPETIDFTARVSNPDDFFYVFTIVFPAFTGLAAGLGLSGDLREPEKSIPRGTLLAYIILGHPEWQKGEIKIFAIVKKEDLDSRKEELIGLIRSGRLPISASNIQLISDTEGQDEIVCKYSIDADLTIIGFTREELSSQGPKLFSNYKDIGNILYVNSNQGKEIT